MRYTKRRFITNKNKIYGRQLAQRGQRFIKHYASAQLRHPSREDRAKIQVSRHTWRQGDRFYNLAAAAYGRPELWWVIAWYNLAPTEAYVGHGDVIEIPLSLQQILEFFDV